MRGFLGHLQIIIVRDFQFISLVNSLHSASSLTASLQAIFLKRIVGICSSLFSEVVSVLPMRGPLSRRFLTLLTRRLPCRIPVALGNQNVLSNIRMVSHSASQAETGETPSESSTSPAEIGNDLSVANDQGVVNQASEIITQVHSFISWDDHLFGWGITLALSGALVRAASMPLVYYSQLHQGRAALTVQEIIRIQSYLQSAPGSFLQKFLTFRRLRGVALRAAGTSPARLYPWYFFLNAPLFVTFSLAVRKIASNPPDSWTCAGVPGWCSDLSASDPTGALPIINTAVWLWNAHRRSPKSRAGHNNDLKMSGPETASNDDNSSNAMASNAAQRPKIPVIFDRDAITTFLQGVAIFSYPFITELPSGMFIFWISSGLVTALQRSVFTSDYGRRKLGLPTFAELRTVIKEPGPPVLRAAGGAVRVVREQLEYIQGEVLSSFSGRRVDESLRNDVNRTLRRERKRGHVGIDLEAVIRKDGDTGRNYLAVVKRGTVKSEV